MFKKKKTGFLRKRLCLKSHIQDSLGRFGQALTGHTVLKTLQIRRRDLAGLVHVPCSTQQTVRRARPWDPCTHLLS